jgi:predicted dehydrogenase
MTPTGLRVALIGCGQIADAHLQELRRIPRASGRGGVRCPHGFARQAAARFGVKLAFDSVECMLAAAQPHVVTLRLRHTAIMRSRSNAYRRAPTFYVEKPFTVNAAEAEALVSAAESRGLRNLPRTRPVCSIAAWLECRRRTAAGELGAVVHVEALQGYDLDGRSDGCSTTTRRTGCIDCLADCFKTSSRTPWREFST